MQFVGCAAWDGEEVEHFVLPGLPVSPGYQGSSDCKFPMDDWLEFLGYLITEGGLCYDDGRPSCLKMSQRATVNPETYEKIQSCLDRMRVPFKAFPNQGTGDVNWTIYGKQFWHWYQSNVGDSCDTKRVPREFLSLSRRQLSLLFRAMMDGDGSWDTRDGCTGGAYYSTSRGLCEDFQEICIKLGLRCIVRPHKPAEGNRKARWRALWHEGKDHTVRAPADTVKRVPYSGKVYCCAVPSGYIVTERNGVISYQGNTGEHSYTVLFVGGYVRHDSNFQVVYAKRFDKQLVDPELQLKELERLIRKFRLKIVGCDWGMGFHPNKVLSSLFGPQRIQQYQYVVRLPHKFVYKGALHRFLCFRTPIMSDVFNAIKAGKFRLPAWDLFRTPFADDMLSIRSEYSDTLRMLRYDHPRGTPDDSFHALVYCFLASMFEVKRADIMAPIRETGQDAAKSASEDAALDELAWHVANDGVIGPE